MNISKEMLLMGIIFNHSIYVLCVVTITHTLLQTYAIRCIRFGILYGAMFIFRLKSNVTVGWLFRNWTPNRNVRISGEWSVD